MVSLWGIVLAVSKEVKYIPTMRSSHFALGAFTKGKESIYPYTSLYTYVHSSSFVLTQICKQPKCLCDLSIPKNTAQEYKGMNY